MDTPRLVNANSKHPEEQAYLKGLLEGERRASARAESRQVPAQQIRHRRHPVIHPKTRRRWFPSVISALAGTALALGVVALWGPDGGGSAPTPVDMHPTVSQIVNGYGQPIPVPAPSLVQQDEAHRTTKHPATTHGAATGHGHGNGANAGRSDTGQGQAAVSDEPAPTRRRTTKSSGGGTGSSTTDTDSGGTTNTNAAPKPTQQTDTSTQPTPEPTTQPRLLSTVVGGLSTTVGDLGDTVDGTLSDVGGLLGGG